MAYAATNSQDYSTNYNSNYSSNYSSNYGNSGSNYGNSSSNYGNNNSNHGRYNNYSTPISAAQKSSYQQLLEQHTSVRQQSPIGTSKPSRGLLPLSSYSSQSQSSSPGSPGSSALLVGIALCTILHTFLYFKNSL